ncbi:branched-chain amino acid transport system ATP-binding protein [Methylobacterium sp. PvP062]|jgi:branched-chain amino acid transport system ATP-binding protein|uniref:ABC transporter ATP-binding protein n=2 Tax=Methylobacterium TaxID=407 RepID=A0ABW2BFX4_9HYPH|nr:MULTISPECIES: ABC transporter ATP-binding protein [Methylobacterium]MCX7336115.1 ABC transporter ATP-binding protein [Hyphomicrobiales bacterium]GAN50639.1 branched-chain amino acid ABC transporter ATP-binding protein [Methylobacterium sp. ME121]KIU30505.1 leucine/isoleucine/valine transporter ATP-binding subunit [Methylobacterium radiotolerans]KZC03138.1 High-affinity branched-chain amino acid transport ATP-binding protein LivF [Methylobacterium radiotolerans]MBN6823584.1 ABC transporter A
MLETRNLKAGYGHITVLWDLSLTFREGALTAIVGPNGAGKTTLLRALTGLIPYEGEIRLGGERLAGKTWDLASQGLVMVPEGRLVFRDMSVEENLCLGAYPKRCRGNLSAGLDRVYALFPRLRERRNQAAGSLSGGEAQMVAMGRGLMSQPKILLIDEPSLGLAPVIVNEVFDIIARLKEAGTTILLVEQNTRVALSVADDVHLLRGGQVRLSAPAGEVDLDRLHDLYFAREAQSA